MYHLFQKKHFAYLIVSVCILLFITLFHTRSTVQAADDHYGFILLTCYEKELDIGDSFYLMAVTSNGKRPTWSSSNSSVASVNTYGKVTAKKAGTATIRAKTANGEASCVVHVNKTEIRLRQLLLSIENGSTVQLSATTSNGSTIQWKSKKKSIATVDENGLVTAKKPGTTTITASADGTTVSCTIRVKKPTVKISDTQATLYRKDTLHLSVTSSSKSTPVWKSNRKSVATVSDNGLVTAIKHGTAIITVTVDGVSKTCEILVEQPEVTLSQSEVTIKKGETFTLSAKVSSDNKPEWSSSNTAIATVSSKGVIKAHQTGKVYIYAKEDGVKSRCTVYITEDES